MADYTGRSKAISYLFQNGGGGGGSCKVISGYYHDGSFYENQSYTQIITGDTECLYIDLDTTTLYLFDGTDYVEVQGGGGGTVSDGTVGVRIDKTFDTNESKTYTYDELGITDKGYYILGIASNHAETGGGWKWYGYLCYSGNTTSGYSYVKEIDSYNISVTMDTVNKTITITNTNSNWAENFRIEILPLHPKVEIPKHTYSTTEQVVGTWIDGKPLYEKTISWSGTINQGGYAIIDSDFLTNGADFIMCMGTYSKAQHITNLFPSTTIGGKTFEIGLNMTLGLYAENYTNEIITDVITIVRYTKSTD